MTDTNLPEPPIRIPRTVWVSGFASLPTDVSSEMIHSLLPVFMTVILGASAMIVGVDEGVAQASARFIDRIGKGIRGAIRFGDDGCIRCHRDYRDAAEELHENLPLLVTQMRVLKRSAELMQQA